MEKAQTPERNRSKKSGKRANERVKKKLNERREN